MSPPVLYQCLNTTQKTVVATAVKKADSYWARLAGLMFRKGLAPGAGLWIVPCRDIHSIWMRFAFDAVFLDKNGKVIHLIESMKPYRISPILRHGHSVLELEAGALHESQTQVGDTLSFIEQPPESR